MKDNISLKGGLVRYIFSIYLGYPLLIAYLATVISDLTLQLPWIWIVLFESVYCVGVIGFQCKWHSLLSPHSKRMKMSLNRPYK